MCKVMIIAGIKPQHVQKVYKFSKAMAKTMSFGDEDGVGYAAITKDCQIYGEKWLEKENAFSVHSAKADPLVEMIEKKFGDAVEFDKPPIKIINYEAFGLRTKENIENTVAVIMHARKATQGGKTLSNVHPFVKPFSEDNPATALIHNGSILNHDKLTKEFSTCDSEVILHEYLANQMYHNPWAIEQLAKTLVGTYTVGVLSSQFEGETSIPFVDIFKSNKELYGAYVPELETMVFSTSQYHLESTAKEVGMTTKHLIKFKDGYLHRLNAITGQADIDPISFSKSSEFMSGFNKQHLNSRHHGHEGMYPYGPSYQNQTSEFEDGVTTGEADGVKKEFERKHPDLFHKPYLEGNLTIAEQDFFNELEKDKRTDHKALRLVSAALDAARGA